MHKPTISVGVATGLRDAIADAGANPDHILRAAGVKDSVLANPDAFIATSAFSRLLEEAAQATGDECFGLHFGERFDPRDIGALAYVVVNSPTVALAMQNIERYVRIHNSAAQVTFAADGPQAYLRYVVDAVATYSRRHHNEYSMAVLVKTFRTMASAQWKPLGIQFEHEAPAQHREHARVFQCPVLFGCATNLLLVEADFIERAVLLADQRLYRILKQHVERILSELPREDDWLAAVRKTIADAMAEGDPTRERVAKKLSVSPRTLERRLREHGLVYRKLLDAVRQQFALSYLRDRTHTLTEIAFLLGYSEVSAFHRAFKRATGMTPAEYRAQHAR
jgi:AraC-like DNA-binding protein